MLSAVPLGTQPIHLPLPAQPMHCQLLEASSITKRRHHGSKRPRPAVILSAPHTIAVMLQKQQSGQGIAALQKAKIDSEGHLVMVAGTGALMVLFCMLHSCMSVVQINNNCASH